MERTREIFCIERTYSSEDGNPQCRSFVYTCYSRNIAEAELCGLRDKESDPSVTYDMFEFARVPVVK